MFIFRRVCRNSTIRQLYTEVAFKKQALTDRLVNRAFKTNHHEIIQIYKLINNDLMKPNYNYIEQTTHRFLSFQKQLSLSDIIMILMACNKVKVNSQVLLKHLENQLYVRYAGTVRQQIQKEIQKKVKMRRKLYKKFERESTDRLNFLTDEFKKQQEEEEKQQKTKVSRQKLQEHKPQQIVENTSPTSLPIQPLTLQQMCLISSLLVSLGCQSTKLLQLFDLYFQQQDNPTIPTMLVFFRNHYHVVSQQEAQYWQNKPYYMRRSVKYLDQYHAQFYIKLLPSIMKHAAQLNSMEVKEILKLASKSISKRRAIKRLMLSLFDIHVKTHGLESRQMAVYLQSILAGDRQLTKKFKEKQAQLIEQSKNDSSIEEWKVSVSETSAIPS